MTTPPDHDHDICMECQTRNACIRSFFAFLQRNPELEAALEATPQRPIQFVLPVSNINDARTHSIDWEVTDEEDSFLFLKDMRVDFIWGYLEPTIQMYAEYEDLKEKFLQILFDEWRLGLPLTTQEESSNRPERPE